MIKRLIVVSLLLLSICLPVVVLQPASAQFNPIGSSCDELPDNSDSDICKEAEDTSDRLTGTEGIILTVANILALISGIIAVIMIVVSGIQMTLSSGDANKVKSSRDTIIFAAVGIVVIVLARQIVVFVINRVG